MYINESGGLGNVPSIKTLREVIKNAQSAKTN